MRQWRKLVRFMRIYGPLRTFFKVAGRLRLRFPVILKRNRNPDTALIGCGQFGVSTLGYFVGRQFGRRFRVVYDIDRESSESARQLLGAGEVSSTAAEAIDRDDVGYVFVASNHASHADYALSALKAGKRVHLEKPIAVSLEQLARLRSAGVQGGNICAGYNRPFSAAVRALYRQFDGECPKGGLSLNCFVSGHLIESDHWYRNPGEGTRVCGNAGHWIDLFVHCLAWRGIPDDFRIGILQADPSEPDDNFTLSIATGAGDVFSLMLTARSEPFEGINETINFQQDEVIAKIDDFRRMTIWKDDQVIRRKFWPKDVGHKAAALQVFSEEKRDWREVEASTLLMLRVKDMVLNGERSAELSLRQQFEALDQMEVAE